jgi:acetyl esterase/lipase
MDAARLRVPVFSVAIALGVLSISACRVTDLRLWAPPQSAESLYKVEKIKDIDYSGDPKADPHRHRLDLFLPRGVKDFPVVVLVHGGVWLIGDNRCCGLYSSVGEFLASRGIGAVLPNYRLSPGVKHPEHIKDVARAFAWTRNHISEYGGRPDQLFVAGHSAGGHLVALLATDERYLKAEGLSVQDVKGVIGISGVYRIPPGNVDFRLGGATPVSFRLDELAPLRKANDPGPLLAGGSGIPLSVNVFGPAFGDDPAVRRDASPINHVRPGLPPFLIITASHDLPTINTQADELHEALRAQACEAQRLRASDRNHQSIMFMAVEETDPVGHAIVEFVQRHQ